VAKTYRTGRVEHQALRGVDLSVDTGEMVAIVGPSGSGKSTLLNILTGIDRPSAGSVEVAGRDLVSMSEDELAQWRGDNVGIVFQFFQLLPTLTALENTMLPLDFARRGSVTERRATALARLERVGLADRMEHFPSELSGGDRGRDARRPRGRERDRDDHPVRDPRSVAERTGRPHRQAARRRCRRRPMRAGSLRPIGSVR
jgi:putative ABC transport system ATP-binding protein